MDPKIQISNYSTWLLIDLHLTVHQDEILNEIESSEEKIKNYFDNDGLLIAWVKNIQKKDNCNENTKNKN